MAADHLLVLTTCPDADSARAIARALVGERLAACVNRIDAVSSTYRWQGEVREDGECLLLVKTSAAAYERVAARLGALHPYELPEIIALPVQRGSADYLDWITDATS
ncbi:MAG TPA: divalent-cation tolerance protein CutA [Gammaproteobacteria bacterium]|nr:divalent-cation tolerance protein CutA [Gammaproteobacteria bacterium]